MTKEQYEKYNNSDEMALSVINKKCGIIGYLLDDYVIRINHDYYKLEPAQLKYWVLQDSKEAAELKNIKIEEPSDYESWADQIKKETFGTYLPNGPVSNK